MATKFIVTIVTLLTLGGQAFAQVRVSDEEVQARAEKIRQEQADKKAHEERKKTYSKEELQALKELENDAKKLAKLEEDQADRNVLASVAGCDGINVLTNDVEQKPLWARQRAHTTVVNASDIDFNIRVDSRYIGRAVEDICPGGEFGLHFTTSFWRDLWNASPIGIGIGRNRTPTRRNLNERILLVATGQVRDEEGRLVRTIVKRFTVSLNQNQNQNSRTRAFVIQGPFLPKKRMVREPRVREPRSTPGTTKPVEPETALESVDLVAQK